MKNKIIIFGLASVLTIGTTISIFAKDRDVTIADKKVVITEEAAKKIAMDSVVDGKGEVTEIELKKEDGVIVYDIELNINNKEFDMEVNANTGEIISQEEDNDDQCENENNSIDSEKDKD